jgi:hypothetical protein
MAGATRSGPRTPGRSRAGGGQRAARGHATVTLADFATIDPRTQIRGCRTRPHSEVGEHHRGDSPTIIGMVAAIRQANEALRRLYPTESDRAQARQAPSARHDLTGGRAGADGRGWGGSHTKRPRLGLPIADR